MQVWDISSPGVLLEMARLLHSHCIPDFMLINLQRSPHSEPATMINPNSHDGTLLPLVFDTMQCGILPAGFSHVMLFNMCRCIILITQTQNLPQVWSLLLEMLLPLDALPPLTQVQSLLLEMLLKGADKTLAQPTS